MFMASKESELLDICFTICMLKLESGGCVMCVSVFVACYQLTNSFVEDGNCFIQWGIMGKVGGPRGRSVFHL